MNAKVKRDINRLADEIAAAHDNHYYQGSWREGDTPHTAKWWRKRNTCKTTACIAGFAVLAFPRRLRFMTGNLGICTVSWPYAQNARAFAKAFKIPNIDADYICTGSPAFLLGESGREHVTKHQAVMMLRRYAKTGEVTWVR